jgi:glycosyltransferase involved in cell wall biosynthesis
MKTALARVVVAIPARDEADLLPLCLEAIAAQTGSAPGEVAVVVSANNCTDDTAARARALGAALPFRLHVEEVVLPETTAHAGGARRHAMDTAAALCEPEGIIITTDADGAPDDGWIAGFRDAFETGVAAVAGRVSTNWEELKRFPGDVLDVGAREWEYQGLSAELEALCDPEAHDPWPRHNQECGANAALTKAWYDEIGGLPVRRTGEDRAMFDEVRRRDGLVRHDMRPHVTVSARLVGRAQGGMADALTMRHGDHYLCDDLLEPALDLARRANWRRAARLAFRSGSLGAWALSEGADPALAADAADQPHFGEGWMILQDRWPILAKRRITAGELDLELGRIAVLLGEMRNRSTQPKAMEP